MLEGSAQVPVRTIIKLYLLITTIMYGTGATECPGDMFKCLQGHCINQNQICDGRYDCIDGADEDQHLCDVKLCRGPDYFLCDNGRCLNSSIYCDGHNDCGDSSDEKKNCVKVPVKKNDCLDGFFCCLDGSVIFEHRVCDGVQDCPDNSDEILGCETMLPTCSGDDFHCKKSHECVSSTFKCDGLLDCKDGSDEWGCEETTRFNGNHSPIGEKCELSKGFLLCKDQVTCLPFSKYCDNITDCLDGGDEGGLCNTSCITNNCSHFCVATPNGPLCTCPSGYEVDLSKSETECKDIDECLIPEICDQRCQNLPGSYSCFCDIGYKLNTKDNKTCIAEGEEGVLVFSVLRDVRTLTLQTERLARVQKGQRQVTSVMFNGHHVYWSTLQTGQERIMRSLENGKEVEDVVTAGLAMPEDISWDWVTENVYFTDSENKYVAACVANGHVCSILVKLLNDESPRGIVVVPQEGMMYWSDCGNKPSIAKAGMDGSQIKKLITDNLHFPNSIAIDYSNERLYWSDAKFHTLESSHLDGTDRKIVLAKKVNEAFSIALFANRLYWSVPDDGEICSCDKFTGRDKKVLVREKRQRIRGIHIYHPALQPKLPNPCTSMCSHICLLAPMGKYTCACPPEMHLAEDFRTCIVTKPQQSFLLIGAEHKLIKIIQRILGQHTIEEIQLQTVSLVGSMTYNYHDETVLISDSAENEKKIISLDLKTMKVNTLIGSGIGHVSAMQFDHKGYNLYWCDNVKQTVEVISLKTHERTVLHKFSGLHNVSPMSLLLLPDQDMLMVSSTSGDNSRIDIMTLDGRNHTNVILVPHGRIESLALNRDTHRIFWSDDINGRIETSDLRGENQQNWREMQTEPVSVTILEPYVFFAKRESPFLFWAKTDDTSNTINQLNLNVDNISPPFDVIKILAVSEPPIPSHVCQYNNGDCSHLCFAVPSDSMVCGCPLGMYLKDDKRTCFKSVSCSDSQFHCKKDETCIPKKSKCDGHRDCISGEDEENCECSSHDFVCNNGACISEAMRCDGTFNCIDQSDELNCDTHNCDRHTEFRCQSGACIDHRKVCNGDFDCEDRSDEADCKICTTDQFTCNSGQCVPYTWECDGAVDCIDGSDEHDKCVRRTCSPSDFSCMNGNCVDKHVLCDGNNDCGDYSDEAHCRKPNSCNFFCKSDPNICLPEEALCNGTSECPQQEDEANCMCGLDEFACRNAFQCIPIKFRCDGFKDCKDGSDEDSCYTTSITDTPRKVICDEFTCTSGECLLFSHVCDKFKDCRDGSDEDIGCSRTCERNLCEQKCLKTPSGPRCDCEKGYILSNDGRSCIDECELNSPCSQLCRNTQGSFICECSSGFILRSDQRSCKAIGEGLSVVYATHEEIRQKLLLTEEEKILTDTTSAGFTKGLAINMLDKKIYWSHLKSNRDSLVYSHAANEWNIYEIDLVESPSSLALDWITNNVYIVNAQQPPSIHACDMRNRHCVLLIKDIDASEISSIVLDPLMGYIYWAEVINRTKSQIYRASMDGKQRVVLVSEDLGLITGLDIDLVEKRLYWADLLNRNYEVSNMDGTNRKIIFKGFSALPREISVFEHNIFLLDANGNLQKCEKHGSDTCERVELHVTDTVHFKLIQKSLQPTVHSRCLSSTCDYLCVLNAKNGTSCLCKDGVDCTVKSAASRSAVLPVFIILTVLLATSAIAYYYMFYRRESKKNLDLSLRFHNAAYGLPHVPEVAIFKEHNITSNNQPNGTVHQNEHQYINPTFRSVMLAARETIQNTICRFTRNFQHLRQESTTHSRMSTSSPVLVCSDSECESPVTTSQKAKLLVP